MVLNVVKAIIANWLNELSNHERVNVSMDTAADVIAYSDMLYWHC